MRGVDAVDDLTKTFRAEDLVAPLVPAFLVPRLSVVDRWCWTTSLDHQPGGLYAIDPRWADGALGECLNDGSSRGCFASEHSGHGSNSYFLSVAWRLGGVAVFVQSLFGGVYSKSDVNSRAIEIRHRLVADHLAQITTERDGGLLGVAIISDHDVPGVTVFERLGEPEPSGPLFRAITETDQPGSEVGLWLKGLVEAIPDAARPLGHGFTGGTERFSKWEKFLHCGSLRREAN